MSIRVGINGFGRIGRNFYRAAKAAGADVDLVNAELATEIERLARESTPEETIRRMDAIGLARQRIGANVAPLLAVEALMVELRTRRRR